MAKIQGLKTLSIYLISIYLIIIGVAGASPKLRRSSFPKGFKFGASSSAYQVEGAAHEDGKGPSIWDTYSHIPGNTANGENGDVAVDEYHRYKEDVQLLKDIGLDVYRFSISWSRIFPQGSPRNGGLNEKGIAYYNNLINELLKNAEVNGHFIGSKEGISSFRSYPKGIQGIITYTKHRYNNPTIYITETGYAGFDNGTTPLKKALQDSKRVTYHYQHLSNLLKAIRDGADVRGYVVWALTDNFEWASGYNVRFGLHYVDYKHNLKRYARASAYWFKHFLKF